MATPDDVNAQHLAAMGLAEVPLGQPYLSTNDHSVDNTGRCMDNLHGARCARADGHDGKHARGSLTWDTPERAEPTKQQCVSTYCNDKFTCQKPEGHATQHVMGRTTWTEGESDQYVPEPYTGDIASCDDAKNQVLHDAHDSCPGLYDGIARNLKRPREWAEEKHLVVRDADGWRNDQQDWDDPVTEAEFDRRIAESTVEHLPVGALGQPMRRHAYVWTGRSADTCSVTEGDQWCGQGENAEVHRLRVRSVEEAFEDTDLQKKLGQVRSDTGGAMRRFEPSTRCEAVMAPKDSSHGFWCTQDRGHEGLHTDGDQTWEWSWPEPTKQREGDQVLPSGDESIEDDQALLIADIEARRQVGIERYGQGHRPFNGRNTIQDFYEEMIDGAVYAKSLLRAREATRTELIDVVAKAFHPEPDGEDEANAMIAVDRILDWVVLKTQGVAADG